MNEEFTFYDDIGMVRQQATCRRRDAELTAQLNHWSVYDGYIDGEVFYFLNGIKTARPDLIRFENGKLKGIPKGEAFFIEQQEFISDGTDVEINFKHAGSYSISSNPFPVKRFEVTFNYEINGE
ncbi:hypothetical protein FCH33_22640 [Serratia fonticola]|uniref:hypothetical protein n=1 Tax=Serratia fonticola TaxID=47917 RepID=UPI0015755212|nr:hypothetical protein [Serratia fonticola]NTY89571.1 hypothetical protein [Serratia fonticola]NTZ15299.1 hypothetical protein [Serratia fonticola]